MKWLLKPARSYFSYTILMEKKASLLLLQRLEQLKVQLFILIPVCALRATFFSFFHGENL